MTCVLMLVWDREDGDLPPDLAALPGLERALIHRAAQADAPALALQLEFDGITALENA